MQLPKTSNLLRRIIEISLTSLKKKTSEIFPKKHNLRFDFFLLEYFSGNRSKKIFLEFFLHILHKKKHLF